MGHPRLATSHITDYDGHQVTYWYTDTYTSQRITVTCSALDFISRLIPHLPQKGMQIVPPCLHGAYAGLYARNIKRKFAEITRTASNQRFAEAIRFQSPLLDLQSLTTTFLHLKWRQRINNTFGYDPLQCPRCGRTLELAEIWEPKRGHIWMKRWLETHRMRKAARQAMQQLREARSLHFRQLAFNFDP